MVDKIVKRFHELNKKYWKLAAALTFIAGVLLGYALYYVFSHETTDDAFIEGDVFYRFKNWLKLNSVLCLQGFRVVSEMTAL